MSKMTITLPQLPPDADAWHVSVAANVWDTPADSRRWDERTIYRLLMYVHDKAEHLWSWCWHTSLRFAPPKSKIVGQKHYPLAVKYDDITEST